MAGAVPVLGIEHASFTVKDTVELSRWYGDIFGAKIVSRSEGSRPIFFLSFGAASLLELVPAKEGESPEISTSYHLCLGVDSISKSVSRLDNQGIHLERPVFKAYDGSPVAFLKDPEGNLIQLVERVKGFSGPF